MHTLTSDRLDALDPRLGRHVLHDSRSLRYAFEASGSVASARHHSNVPTFDQGQVGSCTGNAAVKCLSYDPFWAEASSTLTSDEALDEALALDVYSAAETIDGDGPYPPNDNGSSGLSVAKVLKSRGWISGYQHALSLDAVLSALSAQPVIVGTEWTYDMFQPDASGQVRPTGPSQGGHEYVLDEVDAEGERVWLQNSWGDAWGQQGRAWLSWSDLGALLSRSGDCTVFSPSSAPAPQPSPTPAVPESALDEFVSAAQEWLGRRHAGANRTFAGQVSAYLRSLGH